MEAARKLDWVVLAIALVVLPAGCGTPGAPLPPSLNLPDKVANLAAIRVGGRVSLTWTMPRKNTDKLPLKGLIGVRVCRREGTGTCQIADSGLQISPGDKGTYVETLPEAQATGSPRALSYFVELTNRNGRSAGLSNAAMVLAGAAPGPVTGLRLAVRKDGVEAHWAGDSAPGNLPVMVRLHRTLLNAPKKESRTESGPLAPEPEAREQNLLVAAEAQAGALDATVRFGESYEYRAQRVLRVPVQAQGQGQAGDLTLELVGELSAPVRVDVVDVFPPAAPSGLVAVAVAAGASNSGGASPVSIDLSWQPNTEPDLAGYIVYRREAGSEWQRVSPEQPIVGPAFHDANVAPGHTYEYAVSAVDQKRQESARSEAAKETAPSQ